MSFGIASLVITPARVVFEIITSYEFDFIILESLFIVLIFLGE